MADRTRSDDPYLELPEEDSLPGEHLDNQVQRAHEQLLSLKRQQETIEKQKRELEELSRRQEQLNAGKAEIQGADAATVRLSDPSPTLAA